MMKFIKNIRWPSFENFVIGSLLTLVIASVSMLFVVLFMEATGNFCDEKGELYNVETYHSIKSGCYVKTEDSVIPMDKYESINAVYTIKIAE